MARMSGSPELIDTHCHLAHGRLRQDLAGVLDRALAAGVGRMICAAGTVLESKVALTLARQHEGLWCMAGLHPHEAKDADEHYADVLGELAADAKNVAIGEIGLDYHYDFSPREAQRRVFAEQLALAVRLGKPIVVHTREAMDDTMGILADSKADGGRIVLHCCTEDAVGVRRAMDFGATISFSGIVTFGNTGYLREAARIVPDGRLLVETDAPYCSPEPVRRMKTNEPANVAHVAACLAAVRNTTVEAIAEITAANAVRLFGLADSSCPQQCLRRRAETT
jgi:TatD DNase family protein